MTRDVTEFPLNNFKNNSISILIRKYRNYFTKEPKTTKSRQVPRKISFKMK